MKKKSQEKETRAQKRERRQKQLLEILRACGESGCLISEMADKLVCHEQTVRNDVRDLSAAGQRIAIKTCRIRFVNWDSDSVEQRRLSDVPQKEAIGRIATRLITNDVPTFADDTQMRDELRVRLSLLWKKANRVVSLDSGTTTEEIAKCLARVAVPDSKLASIRVVTNGIAIVNLLNPHFESRHETILVGGALRRQTHSVVGTLAERSLSAMQLQADLAIVGAAGLTSEGNFVSRHEGEATFKSRLLECANIRCIAAHTSKLLDRTQGGVWAFASCRSDLIDIVITDPDINDTRIQEKNEDANSDLQKWLKGSGIYLAVAEGAGGTDDLAE